MGLLRIRYALLASVLLSTTVVWTNEQRSPDKLVADFVMTRTLSVLSDKITSSGTLFLGGPKRLRWETKSPGRSVLVINGNRTSIHYPDLGVTKNFDIAQDPVMNVLSQHLSALTSGDLKRIEQYYTVKELAGGIKQLVPLDAHVREVFRELKVELGPKGVARRVEIISKVGDVTEITFKNINDHPSLDPKLFENP